MKNKKSNITENTISPTGTNITSNPTTSNSTSGNKNPTVYTKPQDLKKTVGDLKDTNAQVMVANEADAPEVPKTPEEKAAWKDGMDKDLAAVTGDLSYLSEVKDSTTNKVSQPFTINGKQYQLCRAKTRENKKVMAVYSLDERDDTGKNIIYDLKEFEENIAKKHLMENPEPAKEKDQIASDSNGEDKNFFKGHKHFIVNEKTGRIRKFKTTEELAKATMEEGEKYMPVQKFRKYIDEQMFGKREMKEATVAPQAAQIQVPEAVTHLFNLVDKALPGDVYNNIKQNPVAQQTAINGWIDRIGVPPGKVNDLVTYLRTAATKATPATTTPAPQVQTIQAPAAGAVTEGVNEGVNEGVKPKVITTITVKDLQSLQLKY